MRKYSFFAFVTIMFVFFNTSLLFSEECFTKEQLESEIIKERKKWDINIDSVYGIEEVIYALKLISGVDIQHGIINLEGTKFGSKYYNVEVYDSTGSNLLSTPAATYQPFDLFPGEYILKVNGTTNAVTVQSGENPNIKVGIINLEGTLIGSKYYIVEVYDSTGSNLLSTPAATYQPFDLLPGEYILKVNGTTSSVTVHSGENPDIRVGVIKASKTNTQCLVYLSSDTTGESIASFNTNYDFDLFPGLYTFLLNDTSQTIEIKPGENILN